MRCWQTWSKTRLSWFPSSLSWFDWVQWSWWKGQWSLSESHLVLSLGWPLNLILKLACIGPTHTPRISGVSHFLSCRSIGNNHNPYHRMCAAYQSQQTIRTCLATLQTVQASWNSSSPMENSFEILSQCCLGTWKIRKQGWGYPLKLR